MHPFGTKCYYLNRNPTLKKMQPRGREGVLVGLNSGVFCYRIWSSDTNTLVTTKHVIFSKKSPLLTAEEKCLDEASRPAIFKPSASRQTITSNQESTEDEPSTSSTEQSPAQGQREPDSSGNSRQSRKKKNRHKATSLDSESATSRELNVDLANLDYNDSSVARVVNSDDDGIPQNYREAVSCPQKDEWIAAIRVELNHSDKNSVWRYEVSLVATWQETA